jgi:hypothetical protein
MDHGAPDRADIGTDPAFNASEKVLGFRLLESAVLACPGQFIGKEPHGAKPNTLSAVDARFIPVELEITLTLK